MNSIKIKQIGDTEIYVNEQGKFHAKIDGKVVRRASLNSLERLITQQLSPLRVIIPKREWDWRVAEDNIVRAVGEKLKGMRTSHDQWDNVYLYDEEAMAKFQKLLIEYKVLSIRWNAVASALTRVTHKNFEELRKSSGSGKTPKEALTEPIEELDKETL